RRLFEPFSQADRSLDRTRGGLGLGLSVVKGLTELHRGKIDVTSPGLGRGASFSVRLPLVAEAVEVSSASAPAAGRAGSKLRVLVIDDNRDSAEMLRRILEMVGHEVAEAYSGPE